MAGVIVIVALALAPLLACLFGRFLTSSASHIRVLATATSLELKFRVSSKEFSSSGFLK